MSPGPNGRSEDRFEQALKGCETSFQSIGAAQKELVLKAGKSRLATFSIDSQNGLRIDSQAAEEAGHAIRIGDDHGSLAAFAAGWPQGDLASNFGPKSHLAKGRLRLPTRDVVEAASSHRQSSSRTAPELDRALLSEGEARRVIEKISDLLEAEVKRPFALKGSLADGASETVLINGHGVTAHERARSSSLRLELSIGDRTVTTYVGGGTGIAIRPTQTAQRLVDRVAIAEKATAFTAKRTTVLLAPEVMSALLGGIAQQFLRPPGTQPEAASAVSIRDDPTAAVGALWSLTDGEGVPTRPIQLIVGGSHSAWLRSWTQPNDGDPTPFTGCRFRASWRDLPMHSCSNLILEPSQTAPKEMLQQLSGGAYLVGSDQAPSRLSDGTLHLPVIGFEVSHGAIGPPIKSVLVIPSDQLLSRIEAVGRDLHHALPGGRAACVAAPTSLLVGVDLLA